MAAYQRNYKEQHGRWQSAQHHHSDRARARRRERQAEMPARQRYAAQYKAYDSARRLTLKAARVEVFEPREIFERDAWTCGICGEPVDPAIAWPSGRSASLDHVIPLSGGGEHSRRNTRCTHLACNLAKGSRLT
ncbi:hypothetical protein B4N89_27845 [Embleya scabrispora]|uniref:HNH nuclease domain-containing protein n=2 Tax=Embleya scabrispora TaxID=159449 RepID=A0A1T3P8F7_9ACTN|nr:hypothetical protein B4N89_27845 [Embleya scabrispora]